MSEAEALQDRMILRANTVESRALRLWRQVPVGNLDAGWSLVAPQIVALASRAMVLNAADTGRTTSATAAADGLRGDVLIPSSFSGVDGSGRDLEGLLRGAVTTTKEQIGRGIVPGNAFMSGASYLAAMIQTAMGDVARSSGVAAATGKTYKRYVRVVNPGACSRCAILAGSDRFSEPFLRHPHCHCTLEPLPDGVAPTGKFASPEDYFESLSHAEQDRVFTKAGAEAIRAGANPVTVANARRGANGLGYSKSLRGSALKSGRATMTRSVIGRTPDGTPILGYVTSEANTVRGAFGRMQAEIGASTERVVGSRYSSVKRARLMPETIIDLTENVDTRRMLLRDAGYLDFQIQDTPTNAWIAEKRTMQATDRAAADEFYSAHGIRLT